LQGNFTPYGTISAKIAGGLRSVNRL